MRRDANGASIQDARAAETSHTTYCPLDEAAQLEDIQFYRPGGFHPVMTGDFLGDDDRFDVWNKLGQGTFGIVWLCHDQKKKRFCAVKILRDDFSNSKDGLREVRIKDMLPGVSAEAAWENHLAMPLEYFWQSGPNGRHLCIVMPLLGPNISASRVRDHNDTPFLKNICFQLVEGVAFLHQHGLCHGDLRSANILFKTSLADLTTEQMERFMPSPIAHEIWMVGADTSGGPHAPRYAVQPMNLALIDRYISKDIAIIDFGTAFPTESPPYASLIPTPWAAPENQPEIDSQPGPGSDLWSLGCTIAEILCGQTPFEAFGSSIWSEMEDALGPIPEPYRARLVEIKYPGIIQDPPVLPSPLFRQICYSEEDHAQLPDNNGTKDILTLTIGSSVRNPHPDWDFAKGELRTMVGKGWDAPETVIKINGTIMKEPRWQHVPGITQGQAAARTTKSNPGETEYAQEPQLQPKKRKVQPAFVTRQLDPCAVLGAVDLLKQVLRWQPKDRVPAEQLLDHEWFEGRNKKSVRPLSGLPLRGAHGIDHEPCEQSPSRTISRWDKASLVEREEQTHENVRSSDAATPQPESTIDQGRKPGTLLWERQKAELEVKNTGVTSYDEQLLEGEHSLDEKSTKSEHDTSAGSETVANTYDHKEQQGQRRRSWRLAMVALAAGVIVWVAVVDRPIDELYGVSMGVCDTVWQFVRRVYAL